MVTQLASHSFPFEIGRWGGGRRQRNGKFRSRRRKYDFVEIYSNGFVLAMSNGGDTYVVSQHVPPPPILPNLTYNLHRLSENICIGISRFTFRPHPLPTRIRQRGNNLAARGDKNEIRFSWGTDLSLSEEEKY